MTFNQQIANHTAELLERTARIETNLEGIGRDLARMNGTVARHESELQSHAQRHERSELRIGLILKVGGALLAILAVGARPEIVQAFLSFLH